MRVNFLFSTYLIKMCQPFQKLFLHLENKARKKCSVKKWAFVVTSTQNHPIIHLFNIIKILNKFKIFKYHRIRKFCNWPQSDRVTSMILSRCHYLVSSMLLSSLENITLHFLCNGYHCSVCLFLSPFVWSILHSEIEAKLQILDTNSQIV